MYKPTIPTPNFAEIRYDSRILKILAYRNEMRDDFIKGHLLRRTSAQRMAICETYLATTGHPLYHALHGGLIGPIRKLALMLVMSPWQVMAKALYKAMKGVGTKESVLNEIIAGCSNEDMPKLKNAFDEVSRDKTLEDFIKDDTSGSYKEALLLALSGQTDEPDSEQLRNLSPATLHEVVDLDLAETDAKEIHASVEGPMGTAEDRLMQLIINRSFLQLGAANDACNRLYGHSLVDAIKQETSGDLGDFLITRVRYSVDRAALYAELLHSAIQDAGTNYRSLQRIVILRYDIDLEDIKAKYAELYGKTLTAAIKEDTTGDFDHLCVKFLKPKYNMH